MKNWKITQKAFFLSKIKIEITECSFGIKQSILGFNWKKIDIKFDSFKSEKGSHIYLYNSSQRVSIVFTEDLEWDFLNVTEDYHSSINFSSNNSARNLFEEIEKRITTANTLYI